MLSLTIAAATLLAQALDPASAQKTVNRYCFGCHNQTVKSGGLSLQGVKAAEVHADAESWEKVLRKVRGTEMPPPGAPRPDSATAKALVNYLDAELAKSTPNAGAPSIHRLNRAEYSNAIRDLLALDLDHSAALPGDDSGYGFDNIGDVLTVSPLLMEKYMSSARRVSRLAVGTVKASPAIEKYRPGIGRESLSTDALPISVRGGMAIHRYFPLAAEYSVLVRVRGNPDPNQPDAKLDIRVDGARVQLLDAQINPAEEGQVTRNIEIRVPLSAGTHDIAAAFLTETPKSENGVVRAGRGPGGPPTFGVSVEYLQIGGPFNAKVAADNPSRKLIFTCRPTANQAEEPCARKILGPLARRAYRRPLRPLELEPLMKIFAMGRKDGGSFDSGIETAIRAILVSPNFLFRVEDSPKNAKPGEAYAVTDLELASRLSFFLWSSIPDDELLTLASANRLRPVLATQVKRMLADSKATALVDNFAGQWLQVRNIPSWRPDPDKYPQFDEPLRTAFQKESQLFFKYIINEDRSILDFINADYTFLNDRLARHYGVKGVNGSYFRKVALDNPERGGILSQAGVLMVSSYPTRTSPVLRGKWILENVLGSPPPPPPADIPDLEDKASTSPSNLRAALEKHRSKAACASCHSRLDPLGFSLENYDAVGRFRKEEGGAPIDSSGAMPNGTQVNGPGSLKAILIERQEEFVDCLAEKLLTYALGRGLDSKDLPTVRQIRRDTATGDQRFSALALAVVNSVPFQKRKSPSQP